MSNLRIARRFVAVGYSRQGLRRGFTSTISRMVADDHDPDTSHHDSVNDESPNRPGTSDRFVPWSQHMQLINRVSAHDNDIKMISLNKRFDRLERSIEAATNRSDRKFETMISEINRRFDAMDRK